MVHCQPLLHQLQRPVDPPSSFIHRHVHVDVFPFHIYMLYNCFKGRPEVRGRVRVRGPIWLLHRSESGGEGVTPSCVMSFPTKIPGLFCLVDRHGENMLDVTSFHHHSTPVVETIRCSFSFFPQAKPTTCLINHPEQMMSTFLGTFLSADRHDDTSRSVAADKRASTWTVDKR